MSNQHTYTQDPNSPKLVALWSSCATTAQIRHTSLNRTTVSSESTRPRYPAPSNLEESCMRMMGNFTSSTASDTAYSWRCHHCMSSSSNVKPSADLTRWTNMVVYWGWEQMPRLWTSEVPEEMCHHGACADGWVVAGENWIEEIKQTVEVARCGLLLRDVTPMARWWSMFLVIGMQEAGSCRVWLSRYLVMTSWCR